MKTFNKKDIEELAEDINKFVSNNAEIIDNLNNLSKLKMRISGMLYFIGEAYTEAEIEVNKLWLEKKAPDMTNEECTRIVEASEKYLTFRKLKYKYKSIDRLITSIRDRLEVLENERKRSEERY